MGFPVPNGAELGGVLHVLKERENVSNPLNRRLRQTGWIIALDEAPEPPVNNVPDLHKESYQKECRLSSHALRSGSKARLRSPFRSFETALRASSGRAGEETGFPWMTSRRTAVTRKRGVRPKLVEGSMGPRRGRRVRRPARLCQPLDAWFHQASCLHPIQSVQRSG